MEHEPWQKGLDDNVKNILKHEDEFRKAPDEAKWEAYGQLMLEVAKVGSGAWDDYERRKRCEEVLSQVQHDDFAKHHSETLIAKGQFGLEVDPDIEQEAGFRMLAAALKKEGKNINALVKGDAGLFKESMTPRDLHELSECLGEHMREAQKHNGNGPGWYANQVNKLLAALGSDYKIRCSNLHGSFEIDRNHQRFAGPFNFFEN